MLYKKIMIMTLCFVVFGFCHDFWHSAPSPILMRKYSEPRRDRQPRPKKQDPEGGDPIDLNTGSYVYNHQDVYIPGHLPLYIERTYDSQRYYNSPYGYGWTINYDMRLTEFSDGNVLIRDKTGFRYMFTVNGSSYTSPHGLNAYLNKIGANYVFREKNGMQYVFDSLGYLLEIKDRNNNRLVLSYTPEEESIMGYHPYSDFYGVIARRKLLTMVSDDLDRTLSFYYDDNGRIDSISSPAGYLVDYTVNDYGDLTYVVEDANGIERSLSYSYNANHCVDTVVNYSGIASLTMEYDDQQRVTAQTYGEARYNVVFIDPDTTKFVGALDDTTTYVFDEDSLLQYIVNCYGDTIRYEHNEDYDLTKITDFRGNETNFDYDFGDLIEVADALNNTTGIGYTSDFHFIDSICDPAGHITWFYYDDYGNLDSTVNALGKKTAMEYDTYGNLIKITDPLGNSVKYSYQASDGLLHNSTMYGTETYNNLYPTKIWATNNGLELAVKFDYDYRRGLRVAAADANGNITYYDYDSSNRLIKVFDPVNPPNSTHSNTPTITYVYDVAGNLVAKEDYYGRRTEFAYNDTVNHLVEVREFLSSTDTLFTKYEYDPAGNLTTFENALGHKTFYFYDKLSRLVRVMYPDSTPGDTTNNPCYVYLYDNPSDPINLYKRVDANGDTTTYAYDALNRLELVDYPGNNSVEYTYNIDYTLQQIEDSLGTTDFHYNDAHQIMGVDYPNNNSVSLTYYDNGLRKTCVLNRGEYYIEYEYDSLNRVVTVRDIACERNVSYMYDAVGIDTSLGNLMRIDYPNAVYTEYEYYPCCSHVAEIATWSETAGEQIAYREYEYDTTGNVTRIYFDEESPDDYITFQYDNLNRLVDARRYPTTQNWTRQYYYDAVGNLTSIDYSEGSANGEYVYDYITGTNILEQARGIDITHDANGNPIEFEDGRVFKYDYENRLVLYDHPDLVVSNYYNGFGDRVGKKVVMPDDAMGGINDLYRGSTVTRAVEHYGDMTYVAPDNDRSTDDARDIGAVTARYENYTVAFRIDHKRLYGVQQGEYENLYITLDMDGIYGSGNRELPDGMNTRVDAAAAWEYCVYVYDQYNYGYYDHNGKKYEQPTGMRVKYTGEGENEAIIVELQQRMGDDNDRIRYTVVTTKPNFVNNNQNKNARSRATDVYPGGAEALYNSGTIDGYAELISRPPSGAPEYFYVHDEYGRQIYQKKQEGTKRYYTYYTHDPLGVMARREGTTGKPLYLHRDHLGSVIAITDDNEREIGTYEYYPFGELSTSSKNLGNFAFTGQEIDWDINLYHFPARYYEPQWGRFITPDPYTNLPDDVRNLTSMPYIIRNTKSYGRFGVPDFMSNLPLGLNANSMIASPTGFEHYKSQPQIFSSTLLATSILQSFRFCHQHVPLELNTYEYTINSPVNHIDLFGYATCAQIAIECIAPMCVFYAKKHFPDWKQEKIRNRCKGEADFYEQKCNQTPMDPPPTPYDQCNLLFGLGYYGDLRK